MQTIPFHQNNVEYNPLYAKMQKRFCVGGTIAEIMEKKAAIYRKETPEQTFGEYHMTHANSLPKRVEKRKKKFFSTGKHLFSTHRISTACMVLLVSGILLFSGATLGSLFQKEEQSPAITLSDATVLTLSVDDGAMSQEKTEILSTAPDAL